jgi:hypothetical protein
MGVPAANVIPDDAMEKVAATASTRDYYADLTDEEREEEGLPPRAAPAAAAAATEAAPTDAIPDDDDDDDDDDDGENAATTLFDQLSDEISGLKTGLAQLLEKPEPATAAQVDRLMEAAQEHDDPVVRGLAEELAKARTRLDRVADAAMKDRMDREERVIEAEVQETRSTYLIGGKPMTEAQTDQVEAFLAHDDNKELAKRLSIGEATRLLFPDAVRIGKSSSPNGRPGNRSGRAAGDDTPTATIVDSGTSGGAPVGAWKPRAGETIESAVEAAGRRFGWKR